MFRVLFKDQIVAGPWHAFTFDVTILKPVRPLDLLTGSRIACAFAATLPFL
jgi:hypothetical protein